MKEHEAPMRGEDQGSGKGARTSKILSALGDALKCATCCDTLRGLDTSQRAHEDRNLSDNHAEAALELDFGSLEAGPARDVLKYDGEEWLASLGPLGLPDDSCVITSLLDWSELQGRRGITRAEYMRDFKQTASLVFTRCPRGGIAVFQQSDTICDGQWFDKAAALCDVAHACGATLLWHKVIFDESAIAQPPRCDQSVSYSHLLGFVTWGTRSAKRTSTPRSPLEDVSISSPQKSSAPSSPQKSPSRVAPQWGGSTSSSPQKRKPDAYGRQTTGKACNMRCEIPDMLCGGRKLRNQRMDVKAVRAVLHWLAKVTPPIKTVVDPFCAGGLVLALANHQGLKALGLTNDANLAAIARHIDVEELLDIVTDPSDHTTDAAGIATNGAIHGDRHILLLFDELDFRRVDVDLFTRELKEQFIARGMSAELVSRLKVQVRPRNGALVADIAGARDVMQTLDSKVLDSKPAVVRGAAGVAVADDRPFDSIAAAAEYARCAEERAEQAHQRALAAEVQAAAAHAEAAQAKRELEEARASARRIAEQQAMEVEQIEKKVSMVLLDAENEVSKSQAAAEAKVREAREIAAESERIKTETELGRIINIQVTADMPPGLPDLAKPVSPLVRARTPPVVNFKPAFPYLLAQTAPAAETAPAPAAGCVPRRILAAGLVETPPKPAAPGETLDTTPKRSEAEDRDRDEAAAVRIQATARGQSARKQAALLQRQRTQPQLQMHHVQQQASDIQRQRRATAPSVFNAAQRDATLAQSLNSIGIF